MTSISSEGAGQEVTSTRTSLVGITSALDLKSPEVRAAIDQHKRDLIDRSVSESTKRAYLGDWRHFTAWADSVNLHPDEFSTSQEMEDALLLYLNFYLRHPDESQRLKPASMTRRLSGIRWHVTARGIPWPAHVSGAVSILNRIITVAARDLGEPAKKASPISTKMLGQMVAVTPDTPKGIRDRALLLVGFCAALRASEVVGLRIEDVRLEDEGLVLTLTRSKTDQEGRGRMIYLPRANHPATCPVIATIAWLKLRDSRTGPLFVRTFRGGRISDNKLNPAAVDLIVKEYATQVDAVTDYTAHSLRSGLATAAARGGADLRTIMRQTGHTSVESVAGYIREGTGFRDNVMQYLDL